jgi:stage II sporulation protein D
MAPAAWLVGNPFEAERGPDMFLARRFRAVRVLSVAAAGMMVAATALVASGPASADEIYPRPVDDVVTLAGHGYGHGHGMSQYGALGAALKGMTWQQIVAFYYPGTRLENLGNPTIRVRLDAVGSGTLYLPNAAGLLLTSPGGTPVALPQGTAAVPITKYRVLSRSDGRLRVEALSSAGWKLYQDSASPAVFSNPRRGKLVDVMLADGRTRRTYRGSIVGNRATPTGITAVSVLPTESYLRAVVPAEMPASWHVNALRAQAVAARSYASQDRASASAGRAWDTCDTTSCQMYSGVPAEHVASDSAVAATAGQALTYLGSAAFTQFSSSNGGWTAQGSQSYLAANVDPYDGVAANGNHTWSASVRVSAIEARWPSIGTYRGLRIISRDGNGQWGGRVVTAAVVGSAGTVNITGADFRTAFGLRSEWFIPTNVRSAPSYPRDLSGDGKADVLAVVARTGALRMYTGNGASGWRSMSVIGTGFGGSWKVFTAGTWTGDALSDVLAQGSDGSLWLYPGKAGGPLGPRRQIGTGWGAYNLVFPVGDFGGDGRSDLMARRPDGRLVLYNGNGTGGFLGFRTIGTGWGTFTSLFSPGDFTGDGEPDIIARTSEGLLYLYPGNGSGGWSSRRLIGQGWNGFSMTSSGDLNGDGRSDLLARGRDGTLWMYPGSGTGRMLPRQAVGTGWNIFSTVLR